MIIVVCHRYSQNYSGPYKPKEPLLGRYDGLEQTKLEGRFTKVGSGIDVGDGGHSSDDDEVSGQGDDEVWLRVQLAMLPASRVCSLLSH